MVAESSHRLSPLRIIDLSVLLPNSSEIAPIIMDFPTPVSPELSAPLPVQMITSGPGRFSPYGKHAISNLRPKNRHINSRKASDKGLMRPTTLILGARFHIFSKKLKKNDSSSEFVGASEVVLIAVKQPGAPEVPIAPPGCPNCALCPDCLAANYRE